jgi:hypothetical protein
LDEREGEEEEEELRTVAVEADVNHRRRTASHVAAAADCWSFGFSRGGGVRRRARL